MTLAIKRVLIIGGYGNFGQLIAKMLARESNLQLIIAGRDINKAIAFANILKSKLSAEAVFCDINKDLAKALTSLHPDIVIHTSGPYQLQGYQVAKACINHGCHYIDLADARDFVVGIKELDAAARAKQVLICSGASSVPCLTSAIVDQYREEFTSLQRLEYAIATAQLTNRGLATTSAALSYAGKPFTTLIDGKMQTVFGWLDLSYHEFWHLNKRPLGNCDIPDLDIFPNRYPELNTIRFKAGLELNILHVLLWIASWGVRLKIVPSLRPLAKYLLKISRLFDSFGKDQSGFYMQLNGIDNNNQQKTITFDMVAYQADGLYIPSMPVIIMTKKLANKQITDVGATPCVGYITLVEYLAALEEFAIEWQTITT